MNEIVPTASRRRPSRGAAAAAVFAGASILGLAAPAPTPTPAGADSASSAVERGRYITHDLSMCVQCHSPRDENGEIQRSREFAGAPIPVSSPFSSRPPWAVRAPNLRGLEGFSDDQILRLLVEGVAHTGAAPQSPMPPFRMTQADARAVIAYLRSLK
jgi:mono/diheme cytochrome c family protein